MALITSQGYNLVPDVSPFAKSIGDALRQRNAIERSDQLLAKKEEVLAAQKAFKTAGAQALRVRGIKEFSSQRKQVAILAQNAIKRGEDAQPFVDALNIQNQEEFNLNLTRIATAAGNADEIISSGLAESEVGGVLPNFKDVQTIQGKKFGINATTGIFQEIPTGGAASIALQSQETEKKNTEKYKTAAENQKTVFTQTQSLRKEFESETKPQQQQLESFRAFNALQQADSELMNDFRSNFGVFADQKVDKDAILADSQAISDIALIFSFFKTVDPSSTVREGEFATVESAGGVETRFTNMYNKLLQGARLNDAQRGQIIRIAKTKAKAAQKQIDKVSRKFTNLSTGQKIDPSLVIIKDDFSDSSNKLSQNEQAELEALRLKFKGVQ